MLFERGVGRSSHPSRTTQHRRRTKQPPAYVSPSTFLRRVVVGHPLSLCVFLSQLAHFPQPAHFFADAPMTFGAMSTRGAANSGSGRCLPPVALGRRALATGFVGRLCSGASAQTQRATPTQCSTMQNGSTALKEAAIDGPACSWTSAETPGAVWTCGRKRFGQAFMVRGYEVSENQMATIVSVANLMQVR